MAKHTTANEFRGKGDEEISDLLKTAQSELFKARFENYTNRLNDTARVRKLRREIARLNTIITERRRSAKAAAATKSEG
jgi:large subunit ribosomal protein L29